MHIVNRIKLIVFLIISLSFNVFSAEENLIVNGNFIDIENNLPRYWIVNRYGVNPEYSLIKGEGPKGNNYVRWGCESFSSEDKLGALLYQIIKVPLKSGLTYKLSFFAKSKTNSILKFAVQRIDVTPWSQIFYNTVNLSNEWKEYNFTFTCLVNTTKFRTTFYSASPGFMDIAQIKLVESEHKIDAKSENTKESNFLRNIKAKEITIAKETFLNKLKEEYKKYTELYQDPDTGLIYCSTVKELIGSQEING